MSGVSVACKGLTPSTVIIGAEVSFFFSQFLFCFLTIYHSQIWQEMLHYLYKREKDSLPFPPPVRQVFNFHCDFSK